MENSLFLKAALLTEGVRADSESLREVGTKFKEQNHGLFGWDFENHIDLKVPDDFCLPDGTIVQFRLNSKSPYHVKAHEGKFNLHFNDSELCEVNWIERPIYYNAKTTHGNDMIKIGQIGVVPFVWSPNPGSKLAGHRVPFAEWYTETILEAAEIVYENRVPKGTENHCYLCDGNSLLHDALRLKGIE